MTGHVYFLRHDAFVKIGFSTDYLSRCDTISSCTPGPTHIAAVHPGTYADEARFHRLLKHHHHYREWYHWSDEVAALSISGLPPEPEIQPEPPPRERTRGLEAVRQLISGAELAKALNTTPQAVSQWKRVPPYRVLAVERLTGVPRHELRPDMYPPPGHPMHRDVSAA